MNAVETITLVGSGKMGVKIGARAATFGFVVHVFDVAPETLENAKALIRSEIQAYCEDAVSKEDPEAIFDRITFNDDLKVAVADTDLVLEAIPEKLDLKKEVFAEADRLAQEHAIIATNSSSIPVSRIEDAVKRRDKVANIHFYPSPRGMIPFADLMRGTQTSDETLNRAKEWVEEIGCLPLVVKKECMGFVFNRIWRAVKREALSSWAEGYADYKDIDRAWKLWSGMMAGPFGIMDFVGLDVVCDIEMAYYLDSNDPKDKPPEALRQMVARGELGLKSGKGFYDWSDPEFLKPEFTQPRRKR